MRATSRRAARVSTSETAASVSARGKMKRTIESLRVERQYRNAIDTFLAGKMPNFTHERHVQVANVLRHLPYGRELMHLGLQTMAHRHGIPEKYRPDITDLWWERLDGTLPDPATFADLPGGASGEEG
jgi:hypothetical protein